MAKKEVIFRYLICQKGIDTQLFNIKSLYEYRIPPDILKKLAFIKAIEVRADG